MTTCLLQTSIDNTLNSVILLQLLTNRSRRQKARNPRGDSSTGNENVPLTTHIPPNSVYQSQCHAQPPQAQAAQSQRQNQSQSLGQSQAPSVTQSMTTMNTTVSTPVAATERDSSDSNGDVPREQRGTASDGPPR